MKLLQDVSKEVNAIKDAIQKELLAAVCECRGKEPKGAAPVPEVGMLGKQKKWQAGNEIIQVKVQDEDLQSCTESGD